MSLSPLLPPHRRARLVAVARRTGVLKDRVRGIDELFPGATCAVHAEPETIDTPELAQLPLAAPAEHLRGATFTSPGVVSTLVEGARWWAGREVALTRFRRFVVAESITADRSRRRVRGSSRAASGRPVPGTATMLRSPRSGHYHTLVDNVPRLLALHGPLGAAFGPVSVLAGGAPTRAEERLLEALLPAGARLRVVDDGRVHPVERLVVVHPVTRRFAGHLHEPWRRLLAERLLPRRPRVKGQRIFISRRPEAAPRGRCVLNETELRPILRRAGFHRYFLEELTFDEQVELFYDAEAVVAPHGAGLANIMFSESIDVLELFPSPLVYPHYYVLSTGMGHRWHRVCSSEPSNTTNFTVDVPDVVAWLERLESPAWT